MKVDYSTANFKCLKCYTNFKQVVLVAVIAIAADVDTYKKPVYNVKACTESTFKEQDNYVSLNYSPLINLFENYLYI